LVLVFAEAVGGVVGDAAHSAALCTVQDAQEHQQVPRQLPQEEAEDDRNGV
jgi:hypothetical protein